MIRSLLVPSFFVAQFVSTHIVFVLLIKVVPFLVQGEFTKVPPADYPFNVVCIIITKITNINVIN